MRRFELAINAEASAYAYYRVEEGRVVLVHTEVPYAFSGQGFATALADGVFAAVRRSHRRLTPLCQFMVAYALKHPEDADLVDW